ncbi:17814_t:CDS:2, partial [Gigaspora rosea]
NSEGASVDGELVFVINELLLGSGVKKAFRQASLVSAKLFAQ